MCGHCKRIRQDDGYWQQLEAYVSAQVDTTFSHGICPSCMEEHYQISPPGTGS